MTNQNNRGRTFWDFISEHPKKTFSIIIILVLLLIFIVMNKYTLKSGSFSLEPEKLQNVENVQVFDTIKNTKNNILKASLPNNITSSKSRTLKELVKTNQHKKDSIIHPPMINVSSTNQSGGITANQVNIGSIPRNIDNKTKNELLEMLKVKNEPIDISSVMGDSEAFKYANQINDFLKSQGYTKVEGVSQAVYSKPVIGQFIERDNIGIKIIIGSKLQ